MEEFRTDIYDRILDLVAKRLTTSDSITYVAKWDTLRTFMDTIMQDLKNFSYEFVASSSQRQEQLEAKLDSFVAN